MTKGNSYDLPLHYLHVKLGQRIGVLPHEQRDYAMMVDCGYDDAFLPLMTLLNICQKRHIPKSLIIGLGK
jgi:hypothetical protein